MRGLKLMLVDDSDVDRYIARRLFDREVPAVEFIELPDGRDALEFLRENRIPDDCVILLLLDINMPIVSGFEFLQEFSELRLHRKDLDRCIIYVMSSSNHLEDVDRTATFPFVRRHLVKMPSRDEAMAIIDEAFQWLQPAPGC